MNTQTDDLTPADAPTDDFDAAFAEASGEAPVEAPAEAPASDEQVEASADSAADEQTTDAAQPSAQDEPADAPAAPAQEQAPTQAPPQLTADAIAEAIARANAAAAQNTAPPAQPAQPEADPDFAPADFLDATAKAAIEQFEKDWPEESVAIRKMVDAEIQARVANELRAFATQMNVVLAPLVRSAESVGVNSFWAEVTAVHPDAKQLKSDLQTWIAEQPPLLRPALEKAATSDNPAEAVELLNLFKQAKGQTGAAPATPAPSAAQVPTPAAPKPAPKLAALTGAPPAQRPKPTAKADVEDFDAAFEEALGVVNS